MSNFNGYFRERGAKELVTKFLNAPDIYSTKKITSMDFEIVEEEPQPASYYIENKLTASWKVRVSYTMGDDPTLYYSTFEIPKEIDGVFIIEGNYRIATNLLDKDWICRIMMSGRKDHKIQFDQLRQYDINKKVLKLKVDKDGNYLMRAVEVSYDDIDNYHDQEVLKLTQEQSKKFAIKLDLDYYPEYINTKLINECIAFGDDKVKDLIIDKAIESVPVSFMNYMFHSPNNNGSNMRNAQRAIANYYKKEGKLQEELNPISTLAFRFFKGTPEAKKGDANLQVPPGINAINLESISQKIVIKESVAYNASMADLIDFADTPINQNTNKQNSLTVSTHISDTEGILFDVYDKKFNKITIKYIDYLDHKVCSSEYVDYDTKTIKPNAEGQVEVKYRMKRRMVDVEEVELIDLHPDYRLSEVSRRIPFINFTDSVRISMGTSMIKQSIPLVNAQRPLVDTGRNEELHNNTINDKFEYDKGKVTKIDEDNVYIKLDSGEEIRMPRRTAIQSMNDVAIYTEPKVKVGQRVKKGDIITGAVGLSEDTFKMGLNTLVLFSAHFGLINEDALVVSQSYAERMKHYSLIDLVFKVKASQRIEWLPTIGTKVKSKDVIASVLGVTKLDEVNKAFAKELGGLSDPRMNLTEYTVQIDHVVPNNIDEAWVSDVLVQKQTKPNVRGGKKSLDFTFSYTSDEVIKEYEAEKDRKIIYQRFPEYIASDTLDPIELDPDDYKTTYIIRIRLIKKTILMVGSKVTNRYGGKGVVSTIVPDELMPIMVEKNGKQNRVEVVMNPYSTINRKIAGVLLEQSLGNIIHRIYDLVEEYKRTEAGKKKIMPMIEKYYPGRYDGMDVDKFIKLHNTKPIEEVYYLNVGCFSDYTPAKVQEMMDELGVETQYKILMPESELADLDELKSCLDPDEYEKIVAGMKGKMREVDKPLQCGWMTLEELYHIPSYSSKVTSSMFYRGVDPNRDEPSMGKGRYRETGQVIEEMSLTVLLSRNAKSFISATRGDRAKEDNQTFLNNLLGLGLTVVDQETGYREGGSSVKADIESMKNRFRLKQKK